MFDENSIVSIFLLSPRFDVALFYQYFFLRHRIVQKSCNYIRLFQSFIQLCLRKLRCAYTQIIALCCFEMRTREVINCILFTQGRCRSSFYTNWLHSLISTILLWSWHWAKIANDRFEFKYFFFFAITAVTMSYFIFF